MHRIKSNLIIILIYSITILISFFIVHQTSTFDYLNSDNSLTLNGDNFAPDFTSHPVLKKDNHILTYTTSISQAKLESINSKDSEFYSLFLIKVADNAIKVYFNDVLIGSRGDFIDGQSNLWNDYTVFYIPDDLVKESNTLIIKTNTIYRSGISAYPIYITSESISPVLIRDLEILISRSISITIGFIVASIFVCILLLILSKKDRLVFIYTALSSTFLMIYCYDYLATDYITIDYLIYKKLIMSGLFFGIGFYSYAISDYYKHKPLKWLGHCAIFGFMIILSLSSDMNTFKSLYTMYYVILLANIFYWIVLSIVKYKAKRTIIFFTGFVVLLVYASTQITIDMLGRHSTINSPLIYISIIGIMPILLAYESYLEKDTAVDIESAKRKEAFLNSVTDPLTGAWNQRYLYSLTDTDLVGSVVSIIDFDNFKKINDTYGHVAGDRVITETCNIINSKIRDIDDLIRYGGDEFVVILYHCTLAEANERVTAILKTVDRTSIDINDQLLKITLSIGLYDVVESLSIKEIIERADFQLYRAKLNGKNQISF